MVENINKQKADFGPILMADERFLSTLYVDLVTTECIDAFLDAAHSPYGRTKSGSAGGRWKGLPRATNLKKPLYKPLLGVIEQVRKAFSLTPHGPAGVSRVVRDIHNTRLRDENGLKLRPDFVVVAEGPSFETPSVSSKSFCGLEGLGYTNAASVFEVRREKTKGTDEENVFQVGLHCQQIFFRQPNRNFVRALLITEEMVQLVQFDRSGTYITPPLDYHANPHVFIRLILGLSSTDESLLGLDTSIQWEIENGRKVSGTITTTDAGHSTSKQQPETVYTLKNVNPTFSRSNIRGRGTTCWLVHQPGKKDLLVKDAWRTGARVAEHKYLEAARGIPGVVTMISHEYLLQTRDFRPENHAVDSSFQNRTKLRIVMEAHGPALDHYKSRYQLVAALRNAIKAHRELYVKARVLHRDISVLNILLGDEDDSMDGFLIDLDMGIFHERPPAEISAEMKTGTKLYQSIAVLQSYHVKADDTILPHGYLDDLESFLYVLCDLMFNRFCATKEMNEDAKELLEMWSTGDGRIALHTKVPFTQGAFNPALVDREYWGTACVELLKSFVGFIKDIVWQKDAIRVTQGADWKEKARLLKELESDGKLEEHYDTLDALFKKALDALEMEEPQIDARLASLKSTVPAQITPAPVPIPAQPLVAVSRLDAHRVAQKRVRVDEDDMAEPLPKRRSTRVVRKFVPFVNWK